MNKKGLEYSRGFSLKELVSGLLDVMWSVSQGWTVICPSYCMDPGTFTSTQPSPCMEKLPTRQPCQVVVISQLNPVIGLES